MSDTGLTPEQTRHRQNLFEIHTREIGRVITQFKAKRARLEKQIANLRKRQAEEFIRLDKLHADRVKAAGLLTIGEAGN